MVGRLAAEDIDSSEVHLSGHRRCRRAVSRLSATSCEFVRELGSISNSTDRNRLPVVVSDGQGGTFTKTFEVSVTDETDYILSTSADDAWLVGTAGVDEITGLAGDDTIEAGSGDDLIDAGAGSDRVDGGEGTDTLTFASATGSVNVDVTTGTATQRLPMSIRSPRSSESSVPDHNDQFSFAEPVAGAVYVIDGGAGTNTIDLTGFSRDQVSIGEDRIEVTLESGETFAIDYDHIQAVRFADGQLLADGTSLARDSATVSQIDVRVGGQEFRGAPQMRLWVNGEALDYVFTIDADQRAGEYETISLIGDYGLGGPADVRVEFLYDAYEAGVGDRNLIVDYIDVSRNSIRDRPGDPHVPQWHDGSWARRHVLVRARLQFTT
ncbi:MAG: carbohydrate-binding domain-containing protein [Pirellulaceae bacterium]